MMIILRIITRITRHSKDKVKDWETFDIGDSKIDFLASLFK